MHTSTSRDVHILFCVGAEALCALGATPHGVGSLSMCWLLALWVHTGLLPTNGVWAPCEALLWALLLASVM
jgi:hypothetical protein